ncbi:MAG: hypothetical protein ACLTTU_16075 [Bilophila wadsworthia]
MNLDRLLPKTSFGRFFLINVISLALFWLLIQPMANYWRNQALFRMVASNESRLFLTPYPPAGQTAHDCRAQRAVQSE